MNAIHATWKNGQVVLDGLVNWPEGTRLLVETESSQRMPASQATDDGPVTPEEIAHTLAAMDKTEPFDLSAAAASDLAAWDRNVKEYSIANLDKDIEDVFQ